MRLYEISQAIENAIEYDAETGEITPESEGRLMALEMDRKTKASDTACLIKSLDAEREAIDREMERLGERSDALTHRATWLRSYLAQWLPEGEKIEDARVRLTVKATTAVEVEDKPDLMMLGWPEDCLKITTTVRPAKTAIREHLEAGETIEGARIVINKHVVIR